MLAHLLPIVSLAVAAVVAKPVVVRDSPISLSIARRFNVTAAANVLKADQARAKVLKNQGLAGGKSASFKSAAAAAIGVPVTNGARHTSHPMYVCATRLVHNLIVDTGSSNTWVGADTAYVQTSSSVDTGDEVEVSYGSGFFFGEEFLDTVTLGDIVITGQSIGVSEFAIGFDGVDGILGLGPVDLTEETTSSGGEIPTVIDNAFSQGIISSALVGISFEPTTEISVTNGELTFGGTDSSKFTGDIAYVPVTSTSPASAYVGIDQSITYGSAGTPILSSTAGITDTGTTLVLIASDALAAYQTATGAVADSNTGLLKITADQFANLESLFFNIGENTYEFTANAQIWPRALNTAIGGDADGIYLIVADLGSNSGEGLDFIDGFAFLERFYYVWDVANARVGFATTSFTDATTN
ncbi:aspartic proteinase precursor [Lenzites betulinus]|nr:aspartic proteinase precursor [Lenzites betulinus]